METESFLVFVFLLSSFQKDLIVWKLLAMVGLIYIKTQFQKDLIVWKLPKTEYEIVREVEVSEGLNSVETR